jgi:hypothetical protein
MELEMDASITTWMVQWLKNVEAKKLPMIKMEILLRIHLLILLEIYIFIMLILQAMKSLMTSTNISQPMLLLSHRLLLKLNQLNLLNLALTQFTEVEMAVLTTMIMELSVKSAHQDLLLIILSIIQFQI